MYLQPQCRHTFAALSFVAETFIFLYVGMDALDIEKWKVVSDRYQYYTFVPSFIHEFSTLLAFLNGHPTFSPRTSIEVSAILLGLILVGRAAFVFPLSILSNFKKSPREKIDFKQQVRTLVFIPTLQGPYLVIYLLLSSFHQKLFADYDMVGWTHARCCVHGPCLQPGK